MTTNKKPRIEIAFYGHVSLKPNEIWPDGGAPDTPTTDDVLKAIKESCTSVPDLIKEWSLGEVVQCVITVGKDSTKLDF